MVADENGFTNRVEEFPPQFDGLPNNCPFRKRTRKCVVLRVTKDENLVVYCEAEHHGKQPALSES